MHDPAGDVGWGILGPGHGFTLVNVNDWQGAVASAPLSHLGFHAPLLVTDNANSLPAEVDAYYQAVVPTFLSSPGEGPYNMTVPGGSRGTVAEDPHLGARGWIHAEHRDLGHRARLRPALQRSGDRPEQRAVDRLDGGRVAGRIRDGRYAAARAAEIRRGDGTRP
jgi:hypothetical protein